MAVTKRIFQLAKEFERDEKEIMTFLATQGIKVSNRLSAVSEETYNMLKAKFTAPPEPEPKPESPSKPIEQPAVATEQAQPAPGGKKKKKKNKAPQPAEVVEQAEVEEQPVKEVSDEKLANMERRTKNVLFAGIKAGNEFIRHYNSTSGKATAITSKNKPQLSWNMDSWAILYNHKLEYPDASPVRYWEAVAKLMTRAFKLINAFGIANREELANMRDTLAPLGAKYQPREIFTEEENQLFEEQQLLLFHTFGHGVGLVNDNLFALKLKAEKMKVKYERMDFLEYVTNPQDELRSNERVPFAELVEAVSYSARGIDRRFKFYKGNTKRVNKVMADFFEWIEGYAKLKEQGADVAKLDKYLELEKKFIMIVEFMSFDNLLTAFKNRPAPFDALVEVLTEYRDNLDDPDAERNFKYRARGITNIIYKPKEYVFTFKFADLEPLKDYRTPEMIAEYEAKKAAEAVAKENPADSADEA